MKKNIYIIIISVITIGCIIFGTFKHTSAIKFGDIRRWINIGTSFADDDWDMDDEDWNEADNSSAKGNGKLSESVSAFKNIKIDANVMTVTIKCGDDYAIESSYNREYLKPVFEVEGETLRVTQNMPKRTKGNNNSHTVIYVPRFTTLKDIDIDLNVGEINIEDLEGDECSISNNVGEITLDKIAFEETSVKTNVGEIEIILLDDIQNYTIDVSTDVGAVTVGGKSYKKKYNSHGTTKKSIDAKSNVGEVKIR